MKSQAAFEAGQAQQLVDEAVDPPREQAHRLPVERRVERGSLARKGREARAPKRRRLSPIQPQ